MIFPKRRNNKFLDKDIYPNLQQRISIILFCCYTLNKIPIRQTSIS